MIGQPLLARSKPRCLRDEGGADSLAPRQPQQNIGLTPGADHARSTAVGGSLGRQHLGDHAAPTDRRTGTTGHGFKCRITSHHATHECGSRIAARIGGIEPLLIGEDDQHVGIDQIDHQRTQRVVVADLDLIGDNGVVLVDDRHNTQTEQCQKCRARVQVTRAIGKIFIGQQNLRGLQTVGTKTRLIDLRQPHLADRSRRLQFVNLTGSLLPAQSLDAFGDRARRDHHNFLA